MKKVLYFTDMPSPYKVKFLNIFRKECDLTVYFERELHVNRNKDWVKDNTIEFKVVNLFNGLSCVYKIPLEIMRKSPDFVFNCYYSSFRGVLVTLTCLLLGKKMIIIADGGIPIKRCGFIEWGIVKLMSFAHTCFSSGSETNKYFEYYKVPSNKIYNYHFSSLTKNEITKHLTMKSSIEVKTSFNLLYVGQVIERKGIDILLTALKNLSDIQLNIVGGNCTDELKQLIEENHLANVHFHGFKTGVDLEQMYADCDVFILPSRYEIWGLVVNEALSFNKPVITSNKVNAGLDLCKTYNCGLVFESENSDDLRTKIKTLKDNKRLYLELVENCNKVNNEYTIDQMAYDFKTFLNKN